jgi:cell division protein FtsB
MSEIGRSRRKRKDRWGNRMALIGITFVVFSLAVTVTIKGTTLKEKDREYQLRLENLQAQKDKEENRAKDLEEYRVYVQTKQYIEEVAKQKLGLVNPDEILLKPSKRK